ncbi:MULTISPECIES: hypothetical protein [unclassified Caulobacter]|uniref:hypothetical protein n=1 Tax=unclassified Caulobacter TaxID=2648921 RepID=UPI0011B6185E|nr:MULTISPECIES: hypothetical protein [unclassified Caulobacter]
MKNPATILGGGIVLIGLVPVAYAGISAMPSLPQWKRTICMKIHDDQARCNPKKESAVAPPQEKVKIEISSSESPKPKLTEKNTSLPKIKKPVCMNAQFRLVIVPRKTNMNKNDVPRLQNLLGCDDFRVDYGNGTAYPNMAINGLSFSDPGLTPEKLGKLLNAVRLMGVQIKVVGAKNSQTPLGEVWLTTYPSVGDNVLSEEDLNVLSSGQLSRAEMLERIHDWPD